LCKSREEEEKYAEGRRREQNIAACTAVALQEFECKRFAKSD
jgi:hypothetical protein